MKRRKKRQLQMMALLAGFVVLLIAVGLGIVLLISSLKGCGKSKLESLALNPEFETISEMDVNLDYKFHLTAVPEKAKLKTQDIEIIPEPENATVTVQADGTVVVHTVKEGELEFCLQVGEITSNVIKYPIVDQAAKAAEEAAKAAEEAARAAEEAAAATAAEEAASVPRECYVRTIDKVRIRKSPSTDTNDNIITTCEIGEVYKRLDEVDDWSRIVYDTGEAYIKSEFLEILSDEEAQEALEAQKTQSVEDALKQAEEQSKQATANDPVAAAAAEAAKAKEDAAKALEDAQAAKAAEEAAAAAAAAAQATQAAAGTAIHCTDGTCYVTASQLEKIHATWDFAGDAVEMAGHHSIGELEAVIGPTQH